MTQNAGHKGSQNAVISIDWMVLSISIFVLTLLLLMITRSGHEAATEDRIGGLRSLTDQDVLVAFDDFAFGTEGWDVVHDADPALADAPIFRDRVLGPYSDAVVTRRFDLPPDAVQADLIFDLRMSGPWRPDQALALTVNGRQVATLYWPVDGVAVAELEVAASISVLQYGPASSGNVFGERAGQLATYRIALSGAAPEGGLHLQLAPADPNQPMDDAVWALDNVTVLASRVRALAAAAD